MSSKSATSSLSGSEKGDGVKVHYNLTDNEKGHYNEHAIRAVDPFTEGTFTEEDLEVIYSHLGDRSFEEWFLLFREYMSEHERDVCIAESHLELLNALVKGPLEGQSEDEWQTVVMFETFLFHEWSIYPEVRSVTRPPVLEDDPEEEYQSFRAMANGIIWGAAGAVIATFFSPRSPGISLGSSSLQILIACCGSLMGRLPRLEMPLGFGRKFVINTGKPWSYREQIIAMLSMAVVDGSPYAQSALIAQGNKYFYNFKGANNFGYIILLILSTSFMGFGVGGIFRSVIIYPTRMLYYSVLPTLALSKTLVLNDPRVSTNGWRLKKWEFFWIVTIVNFGYYWILNILMNFFQFFTWMCWAAPDNVNVNAITGYWTGLGLNPFQSWDPNVFGQFAGVYIPLWAYWNQIVGAGIGLIAACIIWYTNVAHTGHFPINSNVLYDNQGQTWNVTRVLDPKTQHLNEEAYQNYSLPYWSAANVASYGAFFMVYTAGFVSSWLNDWSDLTFGIKNMVKGLKILPNSKRPIDNFKDPFSRRIQQYKEVPEWWFALMLLGSLGMAIGTVEGYKFANTPVWTIFLGVGLACVFLPLVSILLSRTTSSYATNVLFELIVGYALPGNGNALLVGKAYATNFFEQAENWITNQKMAHYAGIAPRTLFWAQVVSTIVTCFVQAGIITWQLGGGIHDMCYIKNKQYMRCQGTRTYFNASVMWGVVGPRRIFKSVYPKMKWCFLIGVGYPIPFWLVRRFGPTLASKWNLKEGTWSHFFVSGRCMRYVSELVLLSSAISPGYNVFIGDFAVCLVFTLVIKKRWPLWWEKYAYLLYAATSNGVGWAGFFNFWATQYHHIVNVSWWGNNVVDNTSDFNYTAIRLPIDPDSGYYFGPRKGQFP